jgi:hypothetical protein
MKDEAREIKSAGVTDEAHGFAHKKAEEIRFHPSSFRLHPCS